LEIRGNTDDGCADFAGLGNLVDEQVFAFNGVVADVGDKDDSVLVISVLLVFLDLFDRLIETFADCCAA
jgi:hypothetical protein